MTDPTGATQDAPTKFLFVDSRVPDLQAIVGAAEPGVRVVVLDAQHDGVHQMADALAGAHDVASIAVVSHGDQGLLLLGSGPLHAGNLDAHAADLKAIGAALREHGDIQLYGCDVAAGESGAAFVAALAQATGADVAASTDATGGAGRGNWQLEISTGTIDGAPVLHTEDLAGYSFSLHTANVSTVAALKTALATAASDGSDDTITLTGNLTFASASDAITLNVTDGKTTTIVGGGFTLSGNNLARVLKIDGGKVTLDNITISNGFVTGNGGNIGSGATGGAGTDALGAGIYNAGTLTISNSTITSNKAAAGGGAGSQVGGGAGAGGGGGGFGTTAGGTGGNNPPYTGGSGTAGTGGNGGGYGTLGGRGGTTSGGVGGSLGGYSSGGAGGTANNGSISIGGGGGGAGYDGGGGAGGNAAGGIYNSGTLTISGSTVTNNIAAGGGGGGGATAGGSGGNGGNGGNGIGAIWNVGTLTIDGTTNSSLATGNVGGAGAAGTATKSGSTNGTAGTATSTVSTTGGGSTTVAPNAPSTPDLTAGTDSGSSSTDNITSNTTPTFTGTATAGATVTLYDTNGTTVLGTTTATGGAWSITSSTLSEGAHTITAKATVSAVTSAASSGLSVTIDTTAPAAPGTPVLSAASDSGASNSDRNTNVTAVTVTGTAESGATVTLYDTNGTTVLGTATATGGNWSIVTSALGEGTHTLTAKATDAAGNQGAASSGLSVTIDTTAPSTTIATAGFSVDTGTSASDFITNTAGQTISGTTSANLVSGEIVEVSIDNGSTWSTATTTVGANTWTIGKTLTGSSTLKVRVTDTAGNSSTAFSQAYVLDTVAPTTTIASASFSADTGSSGSDFVTKTAAQTISGTTSANIAAGEIVQVSIDNGSTWTTATSTVGSNTWSYATTLTASNTLKVRVADAAGNGGTALSQAYTLDTSAPAAPSTPALTSGSDSGSSNADGITNVAAATFTGTAEAGATVTLYDTDGTTSLGSATATGGAWSITTSAMTEGAHTITAKATDAAGNQGVASGGASVTVDLTAPATTIATASFLADTGSFSNDFITNIAAQTVAGTLSANLASGETVEVSIDNGSTWSAATASVGANTWSISKTLTGSSTLKVRVTDTAGNSGTTFSQAYVLDTTAPTTTIATKTFSADTGTSGTDFITNTAAQTISGTTSANIAAGEFVQVSIDNGSTWSTATSTVGSNTWSISTTLTGSSTLKVRVSDIAGNPGTAISQAYTLDTTAPTTTVATATFSADTGTSATDFVTKTAAQTISGTTSANLVAGEIVEVSLDNGSTWSTATTSVGASTWTINKTLTGSSTLQVRVSDTAGNSSTAFTQAYALDTAAPTATIASASFSADTGSSTSDFITNTAAQTISGTLSANMVAGEFVEVSLDNGATWANATTTVGANTWSYAGTLAASNTLKVRVSDVAGNTGTVFSQAYTLDTVAPTTAVNFAGFSADTGSSSTDFITKTAAQTISGTTNANLVAGEIVEVSLDNGATWSTATTSVGSNVWSINKTLTGSDTLKVRVSDTAGNSSAALSQAYTLDTVAPTTTIATAGFSADTGTSASDFITNTAAQTISGTLSANMAAGELVEVSIDNGATWSTATTTVGANTWSIAKTLAGTNTLKVRVSDTAGNSGTVYSQAFTLDTSAPTATIATAGLSADTGSSSSDFITSTASQTISGTTSANMVAGEFVEVSIDNGATWSTAVTTVGANTWSIAKTLAGSSTLKVRVSDTAGNSGTVYSQAYTLDTTAPTTTVATAVFSADTGSSSTDFITKTAAQTISGTLSANMVPGEIVEVSIDNGATWSTATTTVGANTWSIAKTLTGSSTLKVRVSDTAGNSAAALSQAYTLDTTAPAAPATPTLAVASDTGASSSDGITSVTTPTVSGTAEAGATVTLYDTDGTTVLGTATATGGNWSITSSALGQGAHTLTAKATDTAGNVSTASAGLAITVDTTAPAAPGTPVLAAASDTGSSNSDRITSAITPTITGTAEAGATVTLYDTDGTTVLGTATATGGNWSITSSTLAQGAHSLTAKATDTAGNVSTASAGLSVTVDTTAPVAPGTPVLAAASDTGSSNADGITSATTPTITGTAEAGATVTLYDTDGTTVLGTATATGGNWSITSSALGQGAHTLTAKATDTAGNVSTASAGLAITVDTTAPAAPGTPVLAAASDTGSSNSDRITSATTPTITGTAEAGATVKLYDTDGTTVLGTTTATGGNWSITTSTLSQGAHTLTAKATDTAGNTSIASAGLGVTIDSVAPSTTVATAALSADTGSSASDFITNTSAQTISGTLSANMVAGELVEVSLDNGTTWASATTAVGANTWSYTGTLATSNTLKVRLADTAGNTGTVFSQAYVLDTVAPTTTVASATFSADTGSSATDFITNTAAQTISGTTSANLVAGEIVEVSIDNGATWSAATTTAGANTWTINKTLTASSTLKVRVSDTAGNSSAASSQAFVLDTTAPAAAGTPVLASASDTGSSNSDRITSATTPTITGTAEAGATVTLYDTDGTTVLGTGTATGGNWSITSSTLAEGAHTLTAKATDTAGNVGAASAGLALTIDITAPTVTGVTSSSANGTYKAGDVIPIQVTLSEAVTVGGTPQLKLETGTVDQLVNYTSGSGTNTLTFNYTVQAGDASADLDYFSAGALALNGGTLRDTAGNDVTLTLAAPGAAGSLGNAKNLVVDGIAPVIALATVNGSALVLNYTEASTLDGVNKPAVGAFAVTVAGNPVAVTGVAVDAAAKTVGLQLATGASFGETVLVSYTDPTVGDDANAIQDAAGNDAASLVGYAVNNTTAAPAPPPGSDDALPTGGAIYVDGSLALEPERGRLLSFDTASIRDTDGIVAGSFSFQWLRDGAAVTGATDSTYRLGLDDVGAQMSMLVRFTDGRANRESLVVTEAQKVGDADGVPTAVENLAPRVPPGVQGDGNGDGVQDAYQVSVASALVSGTSGRESYVTLVADSLGGAIDTTDGNVAVITAFSAGALQGTVPPNARLDSLLKFTTDIGAAASETFSVYFDGGLGARGFWLQEAASGQWHNVTSAIQTSAGKTRIDFSAADGGAFDMDGAANGVVSLVGVIADAPGSIVGSVPVIAPGGFWF